jgi:hypothetical protein
VVCSRFSNTSHSLVDLGTIGTFPPSCLDLGLDFGDQPLAWIDCLSNISHALGCNHMVWDGTHAVCFFGNGSFGLGFGLGNVRYHGGDSCMDYCCWFLGEDLPLVALPHDTVSRCSIHGFPRDRSSCRLHFWSACFAVAETAFSPLPDDLAGGNDPLGAGSPWDPAPESLSSWPGAGECGRYPG